jgi:hypothetical protein
MGELLTRALDGTPREQALDLDIARKRPERSAEVSSHPLRWELRAAIKGELLGSEPYRTEANV